MATLRIAFLFDEIHRSNKGEQHEEMVTLFDDLQSSFDNNKEYKELQKRKNLTVGFTATPSDHSLARFGEFSHFAENMPIWIPFDSYTMKEAIEDGYILNPIKGIVPVSAKMFFEIPENELKGFENDHGYGPVPDDPDSGTDEYGKKYAIRKRKIYENEKRIQAISKFVVDRLVSIVFHNIRGTAKAMLAVSSIKSAIKYKNDCKIIDFSYKNLNVQNIKVPFEHFSNMVVSDFDPIGDETRLEMFYNDLIHNELYTRYFGTFNKYKTISSDISVILEMENGFADFINSRPKDAKDLKSKINGFFRILNLIEYVIELDLKFSQPIFLEFWRRFNNEYNNLNKNADPVDDVEIYFDNKIGIIAPPETDVKGPKKPGGKGDPPGGGGTQYKFDILRLIEKRNKEEEAIEELIKEFEAKIELLFNCVRTDDSGKRLIARIKAGGLAFDSEEIFSDFGKIYRKFIRRNKDLGEFFLKESQEIINQICDDFEKTLKPEYPEQEEIRLAAEKDTAYRIGDDLKI